MAQMIPDYFDDENTPPGERDFFYWLSKCPAEWLIFHSLDLQAWNRSKQTEIDFLVVIPETGILCIEVKSHERVIVSNGAWLLNGKKHKSPLKQAEDAAKTFVRRVREALPELARIPVVRHVVFPRAAFDVLHGIEFNAWEIWDIGKCLSGIENNCFCDDLVNVLKSGIKHSTYLKPLDHPVSQRDLKKLEQFMRPTFKSTSVDKVHQELRQLKMNQLLHDQQKPVLSLFEKQERLILNGPAGTGKSLIAVEIARRMRDQKLRTGLLCFNRHMGNNLEKQMSDDGPLIIAGTIHAKLAEMLEITIPSNATSEFWDSEFLDIAENKLINDEVKSDCQFQVLVIDEAQDLLCRPRLFELVELLLDGGFEKGRWMFAGDFSYQIFANDTDRNILHQKLESLRSIPRTVMYDLRDNCRNYKMVGNPGLLLSEMHDEVYSSYMRGDGNHEFFNASFYSKEKSQPDLLIKAIQQHIDRGTTMDDIVVLSFRSPDKSAASKVANNQIPFKRIGESGHGVAYGSIHEFKGLESNVVILTDVHEPEDSFERDLFYVGMTRA
ncbi:MAG: hypothetical protein CME31_22465 [Gimesia sp.]|nr:hypothetical protein [Gimesia sp.]